METSSKVTKILELGKRLTTTKYSFEWDTIDLVCELRKTNKKSTRSPGKALALERKLRSDLGRYISPMVQIIAVRLYRDNELRGDFTLDNTI